MQAIACTQQVGWARQARKLMLVATDGFLHFAGEGKVRQRRAIISISIYYYVVSANFPLYFIFSVFLILIRIFYRDSHLS